MTSEEYINCPRAKSFMTPCIARDGSLALDDSNVCVGCGEKPHKLIRDLGEYYLPAKGKGKGGNAKHAANRLRDLVAEYVEGKEE